MNGEKPRQSYLYKPFVPLPNLQDFFNQLIEVRIYKQYLTKFNKAFIRRNFYGHVGSYTILDDEPINFDAVSIFFRVVKGRNNYPSQTRYGIKSRKMGQFDGHSIKFEGVRFLSHIGSQRELQLMSMAMPTHLEPVELHNQRKQSLKTRIANTRIPDQAYKLVNPTIIFNLSLEPAMLFTLFTFADKT